MRSQLEEAGRKLEAARLASKQQESEISRLREKTEDIARISEAAGRECLPWQPFWSVFRVRLPSPSRRNCRALCRNWRERVPQMPISPAKTRKCGGSLRDWKGNGGSGLPYCWALPDGRALYMLKVEMQDTGVIVHDLEPRAKPDDQAWPLLHEVTRDRLIGMTDFIAQTMPLQALGNAGRCRYAIQVVDETGRDQQARL